MRIGETLQSRREFGRSCIAMLLAAVVVITIALVGTGGVAGAVVGGTDAPTQPWVARLLIGSNDRCTGEVIGPFQVLTAAHCVEGKAAKNVTVFVGSNSATGGTRLSVNTIAIHPSYAGRVQVGTKKGSDVAVYDLAVLYINGSFPSSVLPVALAPTATYTTGRSVTLFGWGGHSTLQQGAFTLLVKPPSCAGVWMCYSSVGGSDNEGGDSGGPWVTSERGSTVLLGPVSGHRPGETISYGPDLRNTSMRNWLINAGQILSVTAGHIVRNSGTGESWLMGSDGFMKSIPTGGDYECFVDRGATVVNTTTFLAAQIPIDHGATAICPNSTTPPPNPSGSRSVLLAQGPPAPSGYRYAVTLHGFPGNSNVGVTCHDSVDPQGFFTFVMHTDGAGSAFTQNQCYSADGPDHWVRANGIESNHVRWGAGVVTPPPPPPTPPPTPGRTYTEQSGRYGSPTFRNPVDASGPGPTGHERIPPMSYVEVSCKVKPASTIPSAYPDGYWYRIASSPWSNDYYAVANTFWNGDIPGRLPYTHNTDFSIPDCSSTPPPTSPPTTTPPTTTPTTLPPTAPTSRVWSGSSTTTSNWSDGSNWVGGVSPHSGDSLSFPAAQRFTNTNDLPSLSISSITFSGGPYRISGNAIALSGGMTLTSEAVPPSDSGTIVPEVTLSMPISVVADQTWNIIPNYTDAGVQVDGVLTGTGKLTKDGSGSVVLNAVSPGFRGDSVIRSGKLEVNGELVNSRIFIDSPRFAFLRGVGKIGPVNAIRGGDISVGSGGLGGGAGGTLTVIGDLTLATDTTLDMSLFLDDSGRPESNTNHRKTRIVVTGHVDLHDAILIHGGGFSPPLVDGVYTLIDNRGPDPITGHLRYQAATNDPQTPGAIVPLEEGALYSDGTAAGHYQITYQGGDGNELVTTHVTTPTAPPTESITQAVDSGSPGMGVRYLGHCSNATTISIYYVTDSGALYPEVVASGSTTTGRRIPLPPGGSFDVMVTVPPVPPGNYLVTVDCVAATGETVLGGASFTFAVN